jgi:hypothetical protein
MIINCEVIGGVIRNGEIGKLAKISGETVLVSKNTKIKDPNIEDASSDKKDKDKDKKDKDKK